MKTTILIAAAALVSGCSTTMNSAATREVNQTLLTQKSSLALEECLVRESPANRPTIVRGEKTLRIVFDMGMTYSMFLGSHVVTDRGNERLIETSGSPAWRKRLMAAAQRCA